MQNQTPIKVTDKGILNSIEKAKKEIEYYNKTKHKIENIISISVIASGSGVSFVSVAYNNTLGLILGLSIIATGVLMNIKSHLEYDKNNKKDELLSLNEEQKIIDRIKNILSTHKSKEESIKEFSETLLSSYKLIQNNNQIDVVSKEKLDELINKLTNISHSLSVKLYIKKGARKLNEIAKELGKKLGKITKTEIKKHETQVQKLLNARKKMTKEKNKNNNVEPDAI